MKKIILLVGAIGLLGSSLAVAGTCASIDNINGLTASVKQEMKVQCEQKKLDMVTAGESVIDSAKGIDPVKLTQWGQVAKEFSGALGIAAREMGVAANEFLGTPAGKLTAVVIVWNYMGSQLLGIAIGIPLIIFILWGGTRIIRSVFVESITYTEVKTWYGTKRVPEKHEFDSISDGNGWVFGLTIVAMILSTIIILANLIF